MSENDKPGKAWWVNWLIIAGTLVVIKPGTCHRAVGDLKIINVVIPPFDPDDEFPETVP